MDSLLLQTVKNDKLKGLLTIEELILAQQADESL